jgi:hypothetical protein
MRRLTCSAHDRLVWDLALGRLSDAAAEDAEQVRATCPTCGAWWREELEGDGAAAVELEAGAAFARFSPPHRQVVPWWLAAAAILVLALAGGLLWHTGEPAAQAQPPCCVAEVVQGAFQAGPGLDGDLNRDGQVDAQDLALSLQGRGPKTPPRT